MKMESSGAAVYALGAIENMFALTFNPNMEHLLRHVIEVTVCDKFDEDEFDDALAELWRMQNTIRDRKNSDRAYQLVEFGGACVLMFNLGFARVLFNAIEKSSTNLSPSLFSLAERLEQGIRGNDIHKSHKLSMANGSRTT